MPSSCEKYIPLILREMMNLKPQTMLDVGVGFGKWGFLAREYLETWNGRVRKGNWLMQIDGIEIWRPYITPGVLYYYDRIYNGDAHELVPRLGDYDLIVAGDVVEHLEKNRARQLLSALYAKARRLLILAIPLGDAWLNNVIVDGNPHERHLSAWESDEIIFDGCETHFFDGVRGKIGLFVVRK